MPVYTWGLDPTQKLKKDQKCCLPKAIPLLQDKNIIQVAAGSHCNAALSNDGSVYTWGKAGRGRLGHNNEDEKLTPVKVKGLAPNIIEIACGAWHMAALSAQGEVFAWGSITKSTTVFAPQKIAEFNGKRVVHIGCGQLWTVGILDNGHLIVLDKQGRLLEFDNATFVSLFCGSDFGAAVDANGGVWIFGTKIEPKVSNLCRLISSFDLVNIFGPTGKPATDTAFIPPTLVDLSQYNVGRVAQVSCSTGEFHQSIGVINDQGEVFMWGSNYKGKLGLGDFDDRAVPTKVNLTERAVELQIGGIHGAVITDTRNLYTFGCGSDGRLGHPESKDHRYLFHETVPRLVQALEHHCTMRPSPLPTRHKGNLLQVATPAPTQKQKQV